jgi:hypothetical protein
MDRSGLSAIHQSHRHLGDFWMKSADGPMPTPGTCCTFSNLFYWNELDRGGHFAAYEQPRLFVDEMRACFGTIR